MWYEAVFPEETEDALIRWSDIESAIARWEDLDVESFPTHERISGDPDTPIIGAADVARYGVDETVRATIEWWPDEHQYIVRGLDSTSKKPITDTAGRIQLDHETWDYYQYVIDDTGVGGGVTDILRGSSMARVVLPFIAGGKPQHSKRYTNAKAEAYFFTARLFEKEAIAIPNHPKLVSQLSQMRYEVMQDKRLKILDPGEKATHEKGVKQKQKSPDYADAVTYCLYPTFFGEALEQVDVYGLDDLLPKQKRPDKGRDRWKQRASF